jgi:hypothetical protein
MAKLPNCPGGDILSSFNWPENSRAGHSYQASRSPPNSSRSSDVSGLRLFNRQSACAPRKSCISAFGVENIGIMDFSVSGLLTTPLRADVNHVTASISRLPSFQGSNAS